jgi:hypothetical protein
VVVQAEVEEKMKKRGSNRDMVMSFLKNDIYALHFTAKVRTPDLCRFAAHDNEHSERGAML